MAGENPYPQGAQAQERPPEDPFFAQVSGVFEQSTTYWVQRRLGEEDPLVTMYDSQNLSQVEVPPGVLLLDDFGKPKGYVNTEGRARAIEYLDDERTPKYVPEEVKERLARLTGWEEEEMLDDDIHHAGHAHQPAGDSPNAFDFGGAHTHPHGTTPRRGPLMRTDFLRWANRNQARQLFETLTGVPGAMTKEQAGAWLQSEAGRIVTKQVTMAASRPAKGRHRTRPVGRHHRTLTRIR